jgi:uncharacterized protein YhaN
VRLASFTLHRYGNYNAERIRFETRRGVVNILLAPNSAGKSVLRSAFADLLFGIHNQTPMGFRYGYPGMRVEAEILGSDGSTASFSRRKGRGNMISDADGQAALLHGILGGRDRLLLERLFVLDTEALRDGGKALLESGGDVASALLSAAGGIRQARALKQRLEKQRDDLAPIRRTASRPFYLALDRFLDARRGVRSETLLPDEWSRQEQELATLAERQRASNATAEAASAEIARLERIRRVRPALARHAEASHWLLTNRDAPRLSSELGQSLTAARLEVVTKEDAAERMRAALAKAERETEEVIVDTELLARAEQIERLVGEAGAARKASADLPGVQGQHDHGMTRIRSLLRQLGSPLPAEQAAEQLPQTALLARTRTLIAAHGDIAASIQTSNNQIEALQRDLGNIERRLGELPPASDPWPLESLLETIRLDGDPAKRHAEAENALLHAQAALDAASAQVRGGVASELGAISPFTIDIYGRHEKEVAAARTETDTLRNRQEHENERLEEARAALAVIEDSGTNPDKTTLDLARIRRDGMWRLIYRQAFAGEPVAPAEEQAITGGMPLPLAFERAISEADTIADRRYFESELLARIDAARSTMLESERRAEAAAQRLRIANEKLTQTRRIWAQICAPLCLGDEPALADIQAFLGARERVIEASQRRNTTSAALDTLRQRQAEWARALAGQLDHQSTDLPALLTYAQRVRSEAQRLREQRLKLETTRIQFDDQLRAAVAIRSSQEQKLDAWRERWRNTLTDLARPAEEEPIVTAAVLETLREIASEHRETVSLSERIGGMNAVIDRFTQSVRDLVQSVPSPTISREPFEAVRELGRALNHERELEQRRRMNSESLEAARVNAEAAEQALIVTRTALRGILDVIDADTIEAAEQRLALSAERARFETQSHASAAELHEFGDGFSIDALRAEAKTVPPDEVPARMDAAANARNEASESAQRISGEVSALRQQMDREAADTNVNTASADQQAAVASLSRTLDEALVYHTASLLLGRALEAIEKSGDSEMLRRIGAIFQTLTGQVYSGVVTELDDRNEAHLGLVQRDFPEERQSIDQLSEGTRDQLFLALRVAAIEEHLKSAVPLPFIGDDILQTFDDDRSLAALRVLTELSQHTQVILLTHHRHIPELAARLPPGSVFECQREPAVTAG